MISSFLIAAYTPFRVQPNAAPLKHRAGGRSAGAIEGIPRSTERGSIEAIEDVTLTDGGSLIPRSTERGSIEAPSAIQLLSSLSPFRVQPNAAPLKRLTRAQRILSRRTHSAFNRTRLH